MPGCYNRDIFRLRYIREETVCSEGISCCTSRPHDGNHEDGPGPFTSARVTRYTYHQRRYWPFQPPSNDFPYLPLYVEWLFFPPPTRRRERSTRSEDSIVRREASTNFHRPRTATVRTKGKRFVRRIRVAFRLRVPACSCPFRRNRIIIVGKWNRCRTRTAGARRACNVEHARWQPGRIFSTCGPSAREHAVAWREPWNVELKSGWTGTIGQRYSSPG